MRVYFYDWKEVSVPRATIVSETDVSLRKGRFAPSPTGPLHFGSVVAAVGSCLDARASGAAWLLRIEDVDVPRSVAGAADGILRTLERLGLEWDGPVVWQSSRTEAYRAALERLVAAGQVFGCACSRREMADSSLARDGTRRYPGTCRDGLPPGRTARAFRLRVAPGCVRFVDRVQGVVEEDVAADVGDFVLRRADGYFAYQLAVVVDDAEAGITDGPLLRPECFAIPVYLLPKRRVRLKNRGWHSSAGCVSKKFPSHRGLQ